MLAVEKARRSYRTKRGGRISKLFKSQTADQYGRFDLRGLAPGSCKIFSWTGIENNEWEDADFLKPFEEQGKGLELQDEDVKTVNLKVIEKKRIETE